MPLRRIVKNRGSWLRCRKGATAVEYALLAAGIAAACIAAYFAVGDSISAILDALGTHIVGVLTEVETG